MTYLLISFFLLIIIIIIIPLKVRIFINLEGFYFQISKIKIYQRKFSETKNEKKDSKSIDFIKVFRVIDIQRINVEIGGIKNYYLYYIFSGLINALINIFAFFIDDPFIFNYQIDKNNQIKLNFECIIKSNLGKIIVGLLKRRKENEKRTSN